MGKNPELINNQTIVKTMDCYQLACEADTAEVQLFVLRHKNVTTACLQRLCERALEPYILKMIFGHECATGEIMQTILEQHPMLNWGELYTTYEFKKILKTIHSSERLEQLAQIAKQTPWQQLVVNHPYATPQCFMTILAFEPDQLIVELLAEKENHQLVRDEPKVLTAQISQPLEPLHDKVAPRTKIVGEFHRVLAAVNTATQLVAVVPLIEQPVEYLQVLRHPLVTTACLQPMLTKKLEPYLVKELFRHPCVTVAMMQQLIATQTSAAIFELYTLHEFEKDLATVKTREKLNQYIRIAHHSSYQKVILEHECLTAEHILSLLTMNPEPIILKQLSCHRVAPKAIREQILTKIAMNEREMTKELQRISTFCRTVQAAASAIELQNYALEAKTVEMQAAILANKQVNMRVLKTLVNTTQDQTMLKAIMLQPKANETVILSILAKLSLQEQKQLMAQLSESEFEKIVNVVKAAQSLLVFTRFATTSLKQLIIARHPECNYAIIDVLTTIADNSYVQQELVRVKQLLSLKENAMFKQKDESQPEEAELPAQQEMINYDLVSSLKQREKIQIARTKDQDFEPYFLALAHESGLEVRQALVENPVISQRVMSLLSFDSDYQISKKAQRRLEKLKN
ncbi:MAG: hypothetical protein ACRC17_07205 [Culicoidibacterales bacterium]